MASVLVDDVFAKEAEDVIVDFGGKAVPIRHLRVSRLAGFLVVFSMFLQLAILRTASKIVPWSVADT